MAWSEQAEISGRWPTPANWRWCTLSDVVINGKLESGDARAKENLIDDAGTLTIIFSGDLQDTKEIRTSNRILQAKADTLEPFTGRKLLIAMARETTMGRVGILAEGQTAVVNHVVHVITPDEKYILLDFLFYFFLLQQTRTYLKQAIAPNSPYVSPKVAAKIPVVVPPLAEQQRIITRIEALIYDVEKSQALLNAQQKNISTALEQEIFAAFSPESIKTWSGKAPLKALLSITDDQQEVEVKTAERLINDSPLAIPPHNLVGVLPDFISWSLRAGTPISTRTGLPLRDLKIAPKSLVKNLDKLILPFPTNLHEQALISNHLNAIRDTIQKIQKKQEEGKEPLEQMKQSILEKAFRGLL